MVTSKGVVQGRPRNSNRGATDSESNVPSGMDTPPPSRKQGNPRTAKRTEPEPATSDDSMDLPPVVTPPLTQRPNKRQAVEVTPARAVKKTPEPAAEETPAPAVTKTTKTPAPAVEETPAPAVEETPAPAPSAEKRPVRAATSHWKQKEQDHDGKW